MNTETVPATDIPFIYVTHKSKKEERAIIIYIYNNIYIKMIYIYK
jgi:hypothetical protein